MNIKLSLLLPTHKRESDFIKLLNSINNNELFNDYNCEIIISSNGCKKYNSAEIFDLIEELKEKFVNVTWLHVDKNIGGDKNCIKLLDNANGDYSWIIGDDDILTNDAIKKVLLSTISKPDIILFTYFSFNKKINFCNKDLIVDLKTLYSLFQVLKNPSHALSFLSILIFKTNAYTSNKHNNNKFCEYQYFHAAMLLEWLQTTRKLLLLNQAIVHAGSDPQNYIRKKSGGILCIDYKFWAAVFKKYKIINNYKTKKEFTRLWFGFYGFKSYIATFFRLIVERKYRIFFTTLKNILYVTR